MSDTEEEEEGAFDKEAEKEKLREQLAREEEDRRSTQHMSELLLKGATMTNKHCDACGDPLFRHDGREFCPTCSREGAEGGHQPSAPEAAGEAPAEGTARQPQEGGDAVAQGSTPIDRVDTGSTAGTAESGTTEAGGTPPSGAPGVGAPGPATTGSAGTPGGDRSVGEDVAGARGALVRKLSSLARQAEATEDVGRSRELLAAAREAAEALAAIDRIGR